MAEQFICDQIIDTVNEFIADNPEFDTYYDDNVGFQGWKRQAEDLISDCSTRDEAYEILNDFMEQAIAGEWEPQRF